MKQTCSIPIEDLVAYSDGVLRGGRLELVETHLKVCLACREIFAGFTEVNQFLEKEIPIHDDPTGRARLRVWLEHESARGTHMHLRMFHRRLEIPSPRGPRGFAMALGLKTNLLIFLFLLGTHRGSMYIGLLIGGVILATAGVVFSMAFGPPHLDPLNDGIPSARSHDTRRVRSGAAEEKSRCLRIRGK